VLPHIGVKGHIKETLLKKLLALETDFWRRSARTSRREKVKNEIIREKWI
jgi:hypothetical protein